MSICSVVIFTRPEATEEVSAEVARRRFCEVVAARQGRIVAVLDTHDRQAMSDTIMAFHDIEGVVNVSLAYEYTEPGDVIGNARGKGAARDEAAACVPGDGGCGCGG